MSCLVNRRPIDEDEAELLLDAAYPEPNQRAALCFSDEFDFDQEAIRAIPLPTVEGETADGMMLRNTRWGRCWCAYRTVDA